MSIKPEFISLNFITFNEIPNVIDFYYKKYDSANSFEIDNYYRLNFAFTKDSKFESIIISFDPLNGFEKYSISSNQNINITKQYLYHCLTSVLSKNNINAEQLNNKYKRIYFSLEAHQEGKELIWIEPYYLRKNNSFGLLIDFKFWVNDEYQKKINSPVDKRILQLSGTLDSKGNANKAFYQFKYDKIKLFLLNQFIELGKLILKDFQIKLDTSFCKIESNSLNPKIYQFRGDFENTSPYYGLLHNKPFQNPINKIKYLFVFKDEDRNYAISLLNGLKGITSPSTFPGMESLFKIEFNNSNISGKKVHNFNLDTLNEIINDIKTDSEYLVLPIFLTNSKNNQSDDFTYYQIKHFFTKNDLGCQIVTKELISNSKSLTWSLSNIGLQIFAKTGGKPWKVKPSTKQCLIIGIGSKHSEIVTTNPETGKTRRRIEKYLSYSVVTDSSGLFKEIEILSETDNELDYYKSLVTKITQLINKAISENYKEVVIHTPFKISKDKVWSKVFSQIESSIIISILIINSDHKYFGFDFSKNALVPYESSYILLSENEYLVWFEGLQYNNAPFSKPIGRPVYINLWHTNNPKTFLNVNYKKGLIQDCINLSGANWRGFKAKQLPISIYYCQRISDFLKKFEEYNLEHIEFKNLKPWFL